MVCIIENIFQDGEWAILEWWDPLGLRGCGVFHVVADKIVFQRGYWDKLSFLRMHGLPVWSASVTIVFVWLVCSKGRGKETFTGRPRSRVVSTSWSLMTLHSGGRI